MINNSSKDNTPIPEPIVFEHFDSLSGAVASGWQVSNWSNATGGNFMDEANVSVAAMHDGDGSHGYLSLKTIGTDNLTDGLKAKYYNEQKKDGVSIHRNGGEIAIPEWNVKWQDLPYRYGYYETRMKTTATGTASNADPRGVVSSFFIQGGSGKTLFELDFEFLSNGLIDPEKPLTDWMSSEDWGCVSVSLHNKGVSETRYIKLEFNPAKEFATYGFLWLPNRVDWVINGRAIWSVENNFDCPGARIAMNNWTGEKWFGGWHPAEGATAYYDYVAYYANIDYIVKRERKTEKSR